MAGGLGDDPPMRAAELSDTHDDLLATSQSISADADQIKEIEALKRSLQPDDPQLLALSEEVETLAANLAVKTTIETDLADEASKD
jgi:hypothetical protein